ncbi:MAG: L,D-transpeptidase family protein [Candidatus Omnitrophica bacterium]|nr:L,D-transpeptidase family protein [Candidatus Omnitrophota bacterium]
MVESGDSLYKIAKKYNTTIDLIKKSNHLKSNVIHSGMKLKISKAVYSITIEVSDNKLTLWSDGKVLKTYLVATGKEGHETPLGDFTIVTKLENPTWYKAGVIAPPGSSENILGTRWLGFSLKSYGIHGTTLPETIGTHASDGCLRMLNRDVEELYTIVPLNTKVTVTE